VPTNETCAHERFQKQTQHQWNFREMEHVSIPNQRTSPMEKPLSENLVIQTIPHIFPRSHHIETVKSEPGSVMINNIMWGTTIISWQTRHVHESTSKCHLRPTILLWWKQASKQHLKNNQHFILKPTCWWTQASKHHLNDKHRFIIRSTSYWRHAEDMLMTPSV
jgi:hypothetical protein